ncbi:MAG TPA: DNA gyrase subunit A [Tenuifilaceae bacterium]|nr:DNA gyrase subunit A [Bacteroidales bacterium]MDI9515767.1 DNA gyrase subunit A [Bacteroidota bacterium]NLH57436.1 DNA gyrase subunit A [Rikenellaceae bacterium]OQC62169.1 MAG: DNA gyrase subunit A [Bacteroidetes bacterium ADurb.Bin008]HOU63062.1 DNA gyrase subunit A [Tenuifilaceae bacterium]
MSEQERITQVQIEEQMKTAYIDYSMSVIVSRALPDVRDGLKPVHRRVLFGMSGLGLLPGKPYKKSARIVGEVLGKYHPHGDTSVYDAMVRMAQDWSLRYPLVEGQGNFGSIDGDSPAAMRYTEARLMRISEDVLADLDKNTVDFRLNFDDTLEEPTVLPTRIPVLLVNGASGIAVGMATNIPPHNLSEVIDATCAFIDNPNIEVDELINHISGPDFPTGGIIFGTQGIKEAFRTGRGRVVIRSRTEVEQTESGRAKIIVSETPYMINKAEMIRKIADLINEKKIEGISYINDESDRHGTRIVIILKKEAVANVVLNNLFKLTPLQSSFPINSIALVDGRPKLLGLKDMIRLFVKHRHNVIIRRTQFELEQAEKRAHILEGLLIAIDNIDEVIDIIRNAQTPDEAKDKLMERFSLSEIQSRAIIDMRLRSLTGLEREKVKEEHAELLKYIDYCKQVLSDESLQMKIIKDELIEVKAKYGDARRTEIVPNEEEFNPEDFYADEDVVITISHLGYIKRTPLTEYRLQARGGVGVKGSTTRDEDFIEHLYIASMHNTMLFFTENGKCYWLKVYEIPEGTKGSKGRAIQNLINIEPEDKVKAYINVKKFNDPDYVSNNFIILCTKKGIIKKTSLEAYSRPRQNGVIAITIKDGDQLLEASLTDGQSHLLLATKGGKAIRFPEQLVRPIGRTASGVRGISIGKGDEVIGMVCVNKDEETEILVVSEKGFGKRSVFDDYPVTNRGGKGVKTINITEKTGKLIAVKGVNDNDDLMIINRSGITIRLSVSQIRLSARATQGVKLISLRNGDSIASVDKVETNEEIDESQSAENMLSNESTE